MTNAELAARIVDVERALQRLKDEVERDMILMGCASLAELNRGKLHFE